MEETFSAKLEFKFKFKLGAAAKPALKAHPVGRSPVEYSSLHTHLDKTLAFSSPSVSVLSRGLPARPILKRRILSKAILAAKPSLSSAAS